MANNTFKFEIVSPEGAVYSGEIEEASLPTPQGEITILPHHSDLYTQVSQGEAIIKKGGKTEYVAVLGGFVEVSNYNVTVLADYAVPSHKIAAAQAKEAKERAEKLLREKVGDKDFAIAERELQKSILELDVAERTRKRTRNVS